MNALKRSSVLWHTSVNRKARPVVEGEHDKSWNDHGRQPLAMCAQTDFTQTFETVGALSECVSQNLHYVQDLMDQFS